MKNTTWFSSAICSGKTELFFPPAAENRAAKFKRERMAGVICNQCPVKDACKQYARENNELGFWGGENEEARFLAGYLRDQKFLRRRKFTKYLEAEELQKTN